MAPWIVAVTFAPETALPAFTKTLPYDPVRDFAPISSVAKIPGFLLAVHPSLPPRTVKELVAKGTKLTRTGATMGRRNRRAGGQTGRRTDGQTDRKSVV